MLYMLALLVFLQTQLSTAIPGIGTNGLQANQEDQAENNLWARLTPNADVPLYRVNRLVVPDSNDTDETIPSYKITLETQGPQQPPYPDFICRPILPSQSQSASATPSITGTLSSGNANTTDSSATPTISISASLASLTTSESQTPTTWVSTDTSGSVNSSPDTTEAPPIQSNTLTGSSSLSLISTGTLPTASPTVDKPALEVSDIFNPVATGAIPTQIAARGNHPVQPIGVQSQSGRPGTNKFYANLLLGEQWAPIYTFPYSLQWSRGNGPAKQWGMGISHTERYQLGTGPGFGSDKGEWHYFFNPIGIHSLALSAVEPDDGTKLKTNTYGGSSVNVNLTPTGGESPLISFPVVQGMALITGNYQSATPVISSTVGINSVTYVGNLTAGSVFKYRVFLGDSVTWLIYVTPRSSEYAANSFTLLTTNTIQGAPGFEGTIQIAKLPVVDPKLGDEAVYDSAAGAYPTSASVSGSLSGTSGSYTFSWDKAGVESQSLLMFALPHHVKSLDSSTFAQLTELSLMTTTKGLSTAILADEWTLVEHSVPADLGFAPWRQGTGSNTAISADAAALINEVGTGELSHNILAEVGIQDSAYFAGKRLAKYAGIIYAVHDITKNVTIALSGLQGLKDAFALFVDNEQAERFVYDTVWGGVVASAGYSNPGADFGATVYADHHFHYGYFVYAAAIIAYLDPTWLENGDNKAWVNTLVRDFANPTGDEDFPFSRAFDWYHGHSWSGGLIAGADGKDQESSSD